MIGDEDDIRECNLLYYYDHLGDRLGEAIISKTNDDSSNNSREIVYGDAL
jgi:hypothetical protein